MSVPEATDKRTYMRADDRRRQILACARDVFAERGFHDTSVADICKSAGIGRGTLYQYFANKRDVLFAAVEDIAERVGRVVSSRVRVAAIEGAEASPPRLIVAWCERRLREVLDALFSDEASVRLVLREARGMDGAIDALMRKVDQVVLGAIEADLGAAAAAGIVVCPNPRLTALYVLGGIEKMVLAAIDSDEPLDLDEIVRVATQVELYGLLSPATRRLDDPQNDTASDHRG